MKPNLQMGWTWINENNDIIKHEPKSTNGLNMN